MKKLLANFKLIAPYYLLWIFSIFIVAFLSIKYLPFNPSFPYYDDLSGHYSRAVAAFAHFDGIHYLRLIAKGYDDTGSQAFFPIYPVLIRTLSFGVFDPLYVAIIFNLMCLLVSLVTVSLRLSKDYIKRFIFLFLSFPTSFFLLANYTESLFVLLVILFFHFLFEKKFLLSAIIAGVASGTRLIGVFMAVSLLIELIKNKKALTYSLSLLLISITGLFGYLYFLSIRFGDPLMFIHVQSLFGGSRSDGAIILLPQVMYRYLRILITATPTSILYIRACLELVSFVLGIVALYIYRYKISLSASIFCLAAILLPTLSGTLSSMPRYVIVAIPLYLVISQNLSSRIFWLTVIIQYGILIGAIALFVQGIFIS